MRILMVTPYPPVRDGIASYAVQEVSALLAAGHDVEVLSPGPSAAHHHLELRGWRGPLALAKRVRNYDKVIIQFHPDLFYPLPPTEFDRVTVTAGLALACRLANDVEVRLHETDFTWGEERNLVGRAFRTFWNLPTNVSVHSPREKELLAASTGRAPERIEVMHHGRNFVRRTTVDRAEARRQLGIDGEQFMFLAIGFVQPHKGFDRAVRAFDGLGDDGRRRLDVVGSVRIDEPEYLAYAESLERLADATPGARVHLGYLSDEQFDVWLVAADVLLLPYHFIWSSGVLERAALYGRPVIAMRVGGLEGQAAGADVRLVEDDRELALAMREVAGVTLDDADAEPWPDAANGADRRAIQAAVGRRADRLGIAADLTDAPGIDGDVALRQLPPLAVAPPIAHGIVRKKLKAVVRKLTAWEIDPIVAHVNTLQRATIDATRDETRGREDSR